MRVNHDVAFVGGLVGLGFGLGMAATDFAIHWMGWTGPTTMSMIGAILAWASVFALMAARGNSKKVPRATGQAEASMPRVGMWGNGLPVSGKRDSC